MDKIFYLDPDTEDLVSHLEDLLAQAKLGKIPSLVMVYIQGESEEKVEEQLYCTFVPGDYPYTIIGALSAVQMALMISDTNVVKSTLLELLSNRPTSS